MTAHCYSFFQTGKELASIILRVATPTEMPNLVPETVGRDIETGTMSNRRNNSRQRSIRTQNRGERKGQALSGEQPHLHLTKVQFSATNRPQRFYLFSHYVECCFFVALTHIQNTEQPVDLFELKSPIFQLLLTASSNPPLHRRNSCRSKCKRCICNSAHTIGITSAAPPNAIPKFECTFPNFHTFFCGRLAQDTPVNSGMLPRGFFDTIVLQGLDQNSKRKTFKMTVSNMVVRNLSKYFNLGQITSKVI